MSLVFKEYKATSIIVIAVALMLIIFTGVFFSIEWVTKDSSFGLIMGLISCVLILVAIMVDISNNAPKREPSQDLIPRAKAHTTVLPDEESLKDIPVENRLDYSGKPNFQYVDKSEHSPSYNEINEYEKSKGINN